jgi:hypothetical protein
MFLTALRLSLTGFPYPLPIVRSFSQAPKFFARKDTQNKDSLKPESNEYSKSGSDQAAVAMETAAFDPRQTRPEQELASAAREAGGDVSSSEDVLSIAWYGTIVC